MNSAATIRLSENGLSFLGFLWQVDEVIDLSHLQVKYAAAWRRLCQAKQARPGRSMMLATTHLLFEIIDYLISKGHKRVANSILNSTSNYQWRCRDIFSCDDMVESADQFPPGLSVENRKGMFSLDPSPDGRYHQCWIIDRVMEEGCIWAAKLVNSNYEGLGKVGRDAPSSGSQCPAESETPTSSEFQQQGSRTSEWQVQTERTADPGLTDPSLASDRADPGQAEETETVAIEGPSYSYPKSHSKYMLMAAISTDLENLVSLADKDRSDFSESLTSSLGVLLLTCLGMDQPSPPGKDAPGRRAVFDLDDSIDDAPLVLTPFQMVLESIPRSAARSMSVSWVVEPKPGAPTDGPGVEEAHQVRNMVPGMWDFTMRQCRRYLIV